MKWTRRAPGFAVFGPPLLVFLGLLLWSPPASAQTVEAPAPDRNHLPDQLSTGANAFSFDAHLSTFHFSTALSDASSDFSLLRSVPNIRLTTGATFSSDYGLMDRMEAAFICLDTPFAEQVRLPVVSLWHGRLKFDIVTTSLTSANFLWGLPGGGSLHSLSPMGSGFIAVHAPKSEQASGMHVTFHPRRSGPEPLDDSLIRGITHAFRAGRDLLQH